MYQQQKEAFTIAGLLITLLVMGFVFILAIPIVKVDKRLSPQKINTDVKLVDKKLLISRSFTELNQVFLDIKASKSCESFACTRLFDPGQSENLANEIKSRLKIIKDCQNLPNKGCFPAKIKNPLDKSDYKFNDTTPNLYRFITNKGFSMLLVNNENSCRDYFENMPYCGFVLVDVNGDLIPNVLGKDIFTYYILDIVPKFNLTGANTNQSQAPSQEKINNPPNSNNMDVNINEDDFQKIIEMALKQAQL